MIRGHWESFGQKGSFNKAKKKKVVIIFFGFLSYKEFLERPLGPIQYFERAD